MTTIKKGVVNFTNHWGEELYSVTIRHRRGNDRNRQEEDTIYHVSSGNTFENALNFVYENGSGSPYDYWWIKFMTVGGNVYSIKQNFYCSVSNKDNGLVEIEVDGANSKMYTRFSNSSSCQVAVSKV